MCLLSIINAKACFSAAIKAARRHASTIAALAKLTQSVFQYYALETWTSFFMIIFWLWRVRSVKFVPRASFRLSAKIVF